MKNHIKEAAVAAMMVLALVSCRKESDTVHNFSYADELVWHKAESSFGEQFKILWEGLNTNYAIWDYEKEQGLDWDAVYDKYYPKFTELDTLAKKDTVKDEQLRVLLQEVLDPLHDGHLQVQLYNYKTKNFIRRVSPNEDRLQKERAADYNEAVERGYPVEPNLYYYTTLQGKLLDYKTVDASSSTQFLSVRDSLKMWADRILAVTTAKTLLTDEELSNEQLARRVKADLEQLADLSGQAQIDGLSDLALKYGYLNIDGVHTLDANLMESGIKMTYALLEGNIAYLYFDIFTISPYLGKFQQKEQREMMEPYAVTLADNVYNVWTSWFGTIQALHKAGQLGGVIIDLRGNGGGLVSDYQYVLGALLPSGGLHVMDTRMKRGVGRYDYSPLMPQVMRTYEQTHVTVTEPIVVLANARSVSMSEMTSMGTKVVDNAKLVGTRTWGGFCGLVGNESYSYTYAGHVGVKGKTPVYAYCPCVASFTPDGKLLEAVGVTPDIEVHLDKDAWQYGAGPDSQLDRAVEYIKTGK